MDFVSMSVLLYRRPAPGSILEGKVPKLSTARLFAQTQDWRVVIDLIVNLLVEENSFFVLI